MAFFINQKPVGRITNVGVFAGQRICSTPSASNGAQFLRKLKNNISAVTAIKDRDLIEPTLAFLR